MYAVILAGGGGTRLHPLSRPERPKPFLPLLGERSLLQGTVDRLAGLTDDITVVTDRRYRDIVLEQAPGVDVVVEPLGRNTAAAIALATLVIDRPQDEVMVVLPADQTVAGHGRLPRRPRGGRRASRDRGLRGRGSARHARHPGRPTGDRVRLPHPGRRPRRRRRRPAGLSADPLRGEAQARPRRAARPAGGRRLERRASSCGAGGPSPRLSGATPACSSRSARWPARRPASNAPTRRSRSRSRSTTRSWRAPPRAARSSWPRWMSAGPISGRGRRCSAALGARGTGAVVQAGERVEVEHDDLVVRRIGGRLGVIAPPERGSMTATQPIAVLRGIGPGPCDRRGAPRALLRNRRN